MSEIEIEIDGKKLQAPANAMVIQVADAAGIYIPRFCYHKHLAIAANCRMCLVEVEKSPKPLPACATPVMPGMKVFTRSAKAIAAQKAVMEFLLLNHPLDCPICDQGGECELQDLSMGYGSGESFYVEGKRSVKDKDLGPLVASEMTRCIQCTRCVRFGEEIAGFRELGATGRGEDMEIGTYVQHALRSEVSGNIIDLCPVGALTSKPFRFTARAWELMQHPSIAPHDCLGSNIYVHTRNGKVMRVVPRENNDINLTWLSDRDRFSYEGLNHPDRLDKPMLRVGDAWEEVDWQTALECVTQELQKILNLHGGDQLASLAAPISTVEELYLLQKLMRGLGSHHIDHRLRQVDFSDQNEMPLFPGLNMPIAELNNCDVIFLIGSNIQKEQPIASLHVRKAALKGAKIIVVNMIDYDFHFKVAAKKIVAPQSIVETLSTIADGNEQVILDILNTGKKVGILLGAQALNHSQAAEIRGLAQHIADKTNATLGFLTEGGNSAGAWLAGAVPHRSAAGKNCPAGLNAQEVWNKPRKGYILLNVEPDLDCSNPVAAANALEQANCVIALTAFKNPLLEQFAHVLLPIAPFSETSGTFVNAEGRWQSFNGVAPPTGDTRPAWKVLRALGNFLHCDGFEFKTSEEVRNELKAMVDNVAPMEHQFTRKPASTRAGTADFYRVGEIALYSGDYLVRRAKALHTTQSMMEPHLSALHLHPRSAEKLHLKEMEPVIVKQYESRIRLPVVFDSRVPENAAYIFGGITTTSGLKELFGLVEMSKA